MDKVYIDREEVRKALRQEVDDWFDSFAKSALQRASFNVLTIPQADVFPVVHGRWKAIGADGFGRGAIFCCSACGKTFPHKTLYCPNCGAIWIWRGNEMDILFMIAFSGILIYLLASE